MSSEELTEWLAFSEREPWGCQVEDTRAALIAHVTASVWGARTELEDFVLKWGPKQVLSFEEGIKLLMKGGKCQR